MEIRMNYQHFIKIRDFVRLLDIHAEVQEYHAKNDQLEGTLEVGGRYYKSDMEKECTFKEDIPFTFLFKDQNFTVDDVDCIDLNYEAVDGRGIEVFFDIQLHYHEEEEEEIDEKEETKKEETVEPMEPVEPLKDDVPLEPEKDMDSLDSTQRKSEDRTDEETKKLAELKDDIENDSSVQDSSKEKEKEEITKQVDLLLSEKMLEHDDDNVPSEQDSEVTNRTESSKIVRENTKIALKGQETSLGASKIPTMDDEMVSDKTEKKAIIKICFYQNEKGLAKYCNEKDISIKDVFDKNEGNDFETARRVILPS
jgi:hypothetical protein